MRSFVTLLACLPFVASLLIPDTPDLESRSFTDMTSKALSQRSNEADVSILSARGGGFELTWYDSDTGAPSCPNYTNMEQLPTYYAALSTKSPFKCGNLLKITTKWGSMVTVIAIDACASCETNHIDLSKDAFEKLVNKKRGGLNKGKLESGDIAKVERVSSNGNDHNDDHVNGPKRHHKSRKHSVKAKLSNKY